MTSFIAFTLVFMAITTTGSNSRAQASCSDGWILHQEKCYLFKHDIEANYSLAQTACSDLHSFLAFPQNEAELNFLLSEVKKFDNYGWLIDGVQIGRDIHISANGAEHFGFSHYAPIGVSKEDPSGNWDCIAYNPGYSDEEPRFSGLTTVDCHIRLPYVCSGSISTVTPTSDSHFIRNGTDDIFWVSLSTDKLSYSEAKTACQNKGMHLFYIRDPQIQMFIESTLGSRSENRVEPWWIGLKAAADTESGYFEYTWDGGVPVDESAIMWLPRSHNYVQRIFLLGSGDVLLQSSSFNSSPQAPFICMNYSRAGYEYDCPSSFWIRGPLSCYLFEVEPLTWDAAAANCYNQKSYLLSIDSNDEMNWLQNMSRVLGSNFNSWTSLNDKTKENKFVWNDGSELDTQIVDWAKPLAEDVFESGLCATLYLPDLVSPVSCDSLQTYGCQYNAPDGICYNSKWSYYQGICYLTRFEFAKKSTFNSARTTCASLVPGSTINPELLKIESKGVLDFLARTIQDFAYVGLGLNAQSTPRTWKWPDNTAADLTIFSHATEPDNGSGKGGQQDCVTLSGVGHLLDQSCGNAQPHICEMVPGSTFVPTVAPTTTKKPSSGTELRHGVGFLICLIFCRMFTL